MTKEAGQRSDLVGRSIGDYRIVSMIGRGGMGEVYRADHLPLGRSVALKRLPPEYSGDVDRRRRFENEARAVAALNHPNIVTIFSVEEAEDLTFLTMELVEGRNLSELISRGGMKVDELLGIALPLADALQAAHSKGVVHRDLKPQNVMVSDEGRVKVLDFGLARLASEEPGPESDIEALTASLTGQGRLIGTLPYMAPEQVRGAETDARSDIFSLGVILYQMATGSRPFPSGNAAELISEILGANPPPPEEVNPRLPRQLGRIIGHCLRKDPENRFQSAKELHNQLDELQAEVRQSKTATTTIARQRTGRHRLALAGAAALLAIVVAFLGASWLGRTAEVAPPPEPAAARAPMEGERLKIVVLPFANLGPSEDEYFASGIADEIATSLGTVRDLGVISRLSALQYAEGDKSIQQIGAELSVDYVLEGTVRWSRDPDGTRRVRVLPKLNRVADNIQVWSTPYERVLQDIFAVQSDIASEVLRQLELTIEAERTGSVTPATTELEAYQAYLRGVDLANSLSYDVDALRRAAEMFELATRIDPEFSLAFARLSRIHSYLYFNYSAPRDLAVAREALDRALAIEPGRPEVRVAAGFFSYYGLRDFERALDQFTVAARSLPNEVDVMRGIGWVLRRLGRLEEAARRLEEAFELDPRGGSTALAVAEAHGAMRDYETEAEFLDRAIRLAPDHAHYWGDRALNELNRTGSTATARALLERAPVPPDDPALAVFDIRANLYDRDWEAVVERYSRLDPSTVAPYVPFRLSWQAALALERMGREDEARRQLEADLKRLDAMTAEEPGDDFLHSLRGIVLARLGRAEEALAESRSAVSLRGNDAWSGPFLEEEMAVVYASLGKSEEAIDLLGRLLATDYQLAINTLRLRLDPVWDPLRSEPGFAALVGEG